ncbi:uncharacterized protein LOC105208720 [Zeugodacus cucurbitae]|uniref:uncharacterized protein LOC105208720 n=1 Tax=Zeugodacus cucurbitae TaxID=28588 RepID=UPI0023D920BC|nr:uncharacterized protein LOC105208720 [Zeugodacus cucurbitae]
MRFTAFQRSCWLLVWTFTWTLHHAYAEEELKLSSLKEELFIDRRPPPSVEEIYKLIEQELPSLPLEFMQRHIDDELRLNDSCAPYPQLMQLEFHNTYWQVHRSDNLTFYLYGAYYDNRTAVVSHEGAPLVRILASVNVIDVDLKDYRPSYCQLWYEEHSVPFIVPVHAYRQLWYKPWDGNPELYFPQFVECAIPTEVQHLVPKTVSLVASECARATNNLGVIYEPPVNQPQRGFAVCSTGLFNPYRDNSVRLVEWLELLRLLGAEHVMLPTFGIHPNATKVLRYYEAEGFVSAPGISFARGEPSLPHIAFEMIKASLGNHRVNELIPLNDCLCRNMYKYDYIVIIDVDEVIMPVGATRNWADMTPLAEAQTRQDDCEEGASSLCFRNVYFPAYPERKPFSDAVPHYMYMMQHVARVADHLEPYVATKCFHSTHSVVGVHNHFPMQWVAGCHMRSVNVSIGQMQHYREPDIPETLENPVIDEVIWRYKEPLVQHTQAVLRQLGLLRWVEVPLNDAQEEAIIVEKPIDVELKSSQTAQKLESKVEPESNMEKDSVAQSAKTAEHFEL